MPDEAFNPALSDSLIPELAETLPALPDRDRPEVAIETPIISFRHVSMWFGERKILDDVSFELMRGQTLCILGRSGVGKSVGLLETPGGLDPRGRGRDQRDQRRRYAGDSQAGDDGFPEWCAV